MTHPLRNPQRAYDENGNEIPPATVASTWALGMETVMAFCFETWNRRAPNENLFTSLGHGPYGPEPCPGSMDPLRQTPDRGTRSSRGWLNPRY
jgi:hypothetical protein